MTRSTHKLLARARGFTLVEVLVALVILSIGLLGIASLQLSSLRWNQGAAARSQATLLAYDIVDRMRANQKSATGGEYDQAFGAATGNSGSVSLADKQRWKTLLSQTLPSGDGKVERTATGATTTFRVTIQWDDTHGAVNAQQASDEPTVTFVMETQI
jgi:type IV pilus assembly protein PilV